MRLQRNNWKDRLQEFFDIPVDMIQWVRTQWNVEFGRVRRDVKMEGSPERTLSRTVLEDKAGTLFLYEKFDQSKYRLRHQVARAVDHVKANGLSQALGPEKTASNEFLPFYGDACFQLTKYVCSTGIERPQYLESDKIGDSFAQFLINLHQVSRGIDKIIPKAPFSITDYIYKLFDQMKTHDPLAYDAFSPILAFLEKEFMDAHDHLPVMFCHGDLHPLNVIWDGHRIKAVIDWEFTGFKPEIYDVANLVGCAGIEDPNGLGQPMVMNFLSRLKSAGIISDMGWFYLPEYMIAQRFAWLSEWLRKKDVPMIELEEIYLKLLIKEIDVLKQGWKIS